MIEQNALHHAEKCRFCWMCRHLCPVEHQTGREVNTPRAKGLLLSMVSKGTQAFDKDVASAMYECLLCDACTNDCATGYQPPLFIRQARTEAVVNDLAPKAVMDLIDNIDRTGNLYGEDKPGFGQEGQDVLVYIGEIAALRAQNMAKNFLALLKKAGVSAKVLAQEPASGFLLGDLMGYTEEVRQQALCCAKALNETGLPVVVLDSYDAEIMTQKYPEWGCEITAGVTTATAYAAELLRQGKIAPKAANGEKAACHDDDRLARTFHEFEPIRALSRAAGFDLGEMFNRERLAKSCGTALALAYMPELTVKIAAARWEDLERVGCTTMVTTNPQAWLCLNRCVPAGCHLADLYGALL